VIATEAHRRAFEFELAAGGTDLLEAAADGGLVLLDAAQTLARLMPNGEIDGTAFRDVIGSVVREAGRRGRPVHAYGEMVALLWDAGNVLGAIRLEELRNELARDHHFALVCGYHTAATSDREHDQALRHVCHLHSHVLDASNVRIKRRYNQFSLRPTSSASSSQWPTRRALPAASSPLH
jgi:hypothetical protein